jgi:hypothetical protein
MISFRKINPEEIGGILDRGTFDELLHSVEHARLECKGDLYDLKTAFGKIELAKDVSALANSVGGYILIGVSTTKDPSHRLDEVTGLSCFDRSLFDGDQYRKIITSLVYPPIRNLQIDWHASTSEPAKGIASIFVPPECQEDHPYLVTKAEMDSYISGKIFGFFERIEHDALPTSVEEFRGRLRDGRRNRELSLRLEGIETLMSMRVAKELSRRESIGIEKLFQRAADARVAIGLNEVPAFFLAAAPVEPVRFTTIFAGRESKEVKLINNPPKYRENGFDLDPNSDWTTQIVQGRLIRRAANLEKCLELWRDGSLIFVSRSDEAFLGWARKSDGTTQPINNYVLGEVVSLFFGLAIQVFAFTEPLAQRIQVCFGFFGTQEKDVPYELSHHPLANYAPYGFKGVSAPTSGEKTFVVDFDLKDAKPEVEAYKLLREIYNWFGFTDDNIPYIKRNESPHRIDLTVYIGRTP